MALGIFMYVCGMWFGHRHADDGVACPWLLSPMTLVGEGKIAIGRIFSS